MSHQVSFPGNGTSEEQKEDNKKPSASVKADTEITTGDFRSPELKAKQEAYLTSGFGKSSEKIRNVDAFWQKVWPALQERGWTKLENYHIGQGGSQSGGAAQTSTNGKIFFVPKGVDVKSAVRGVDYYDRIKDVLDRLNQRRNEAEATVADLYRREISRPAHHTTTTTSRKELTAIAQTASVAASSASSTTHASTSTTNNITQTPAISSSSRPKRRAATRKKIELPVLDLSWKNGGKNFPKATSRVGPEYQATTIPSATAAVGGKTEADDSDVGTHTLVWDPKVAEQKGVDLVNQDPLDAFPHSIREQVLMLMAERGYDADAIVSDAKNIADQLAPNNVSEWDEEKKRKFHFELFRSRKDLKAVCKTMGISINTGLAFYLGVFKRSDHYRLLKTVCAEERIERLAASEHGMDACAVCGDGGSLLICDGCEGEYHMTCVNPPLASIPEGHWECDECVDRKFLLARDSLISRTTIFEKVENRKRSHDQIEPPPVESGKVHMEVYIPSQRIVEAVRKFAAKLNSALSESP